MQEIAPEALEKPQLSRELVRIALPLVMSNLAFTLFSSIDTFFMGRVSVTAMGAVGIAGMTFVTALLLPRGAVSGSVTFVSRMFGAGDKKEAGAYFGYFMFLALLLSPLAFIMPLAFEGYFNIVKPEPTVREAVMTFLNIRIYEIPFDLINGVTNGFLAGIGNTSLSMLLSGLGVALNIILNWVLVFGKFGLPALGIAGSALGTAISVTVQCITGVIVVYLIYRDEYKIRLLRLPDFKRLIRMVRIGGPMGIMDFFEVAGWTTFMALVSRLGTVELASSQIAMQVSGVAFMPGLALGTATCSLVSRYIGAADINSAEKVGYRGALLAIGFMGILGLVFFLAPGPLAVLFTRNTAVIRMSIVLLRLLAVYQIFDAMNIVFRNALNGAGDTRFTMLSVSLGSWLLLVPLVYIATFNLKLGITGSWTAVIIYIAIMGMTLGLRFRTGKWKNMTI